MFQDRVKTPGAATSPKVEMVSAGSPLTEQRLYLIPLRVKAHTIFDTYDIDIQMAVAGGDSCDIAMAIYERVGAISGNPSSRLIANTTATLNSAGGVVYTLTLGTMTSLLPSDYFIGFMFDSHTHPGSVILLSRNSHTNNFWVIGDWCYEDQASFVLPTSTGPLSYIHTIGECPMWAAISYTGDVIP